MRNIVLIHGWGASVAKLKPLGDELDKLGWKVYIPKLPGFDLDAPSKPWRVEDYSNYIYKNLPKNFKRYFVFGHSFGGRIAADMSLAHENITGLVLCATSGITRGNLLKRYAFRVAAKLGKPLASERYKKLLYKGAREHDYEKSEGVMKETFKLVIDFSIKPILDKIDKDILVLWGDEDKMTPVKDANYISRHTSKSSVKIYKGFGHTLPYINAKVMSKDIDSWYTQVK